MADSTFYYGAQYASTTLSKAGGLNATDTSGIVVATIPTTVTATKPGIVCLTWSDPLDTDKAEFISYTSINAGTKELQGATRGVDGYSGKNHDNGCTVAWIISASHINEIAKALDGTNSGVTLDTPKVKTAITDSGGNEVIKTPATASAVNEVTITNAATGSSPEISATGSDTNIDVKIKGKGTGHLQGYDNISAGYFDVVPYSSLTRQAVINGNFDVWQRGTTFTTGGAYTADRWHFASAGASGTVARAEETTFSSNRYYAVVTNATSVTLSGLRQMIETENSLKLLGKKLTLSLDLRKQASQTGNVVVHIQYSTVANSAFGESVTTVATLTVTAAELSTTDWTSFSVTTAAVIPNTARTLYLHIGNGQAGGANVGYHVRKVQLCAGEVALPFQPKSFEDELKACQRYAFVITTTNSYQCIAVGFNELTTRALPFVTFPVNMRTIPTLTATAGDWQVAQAAGAVDLSAIALSIILDSNRGVLLFADVASGLTAGQGSILRADGTTGRIMIFSAEL